MYASVHTASSAGTDPATFPRGGRPLGACTLEEASGDRVVVAFWPSRDAACRAVLPEADQGGNSGTRVYEVVDGHAGAAAGATPRFASRTCFDGPRTAAQSAAAQRAGQERIWPALAGIPGIVAVHVLQGEDNGLLVLGLLTDAETSEAIQRAIMATELLPGEDPALLTGPDRVQLDRVVSAELAAMATVPA